MDWLDRLTFREIEMINEVGCIPFFKKILFIYLFIFREREGREKEREGNIDV